MTGAPRAARGAARAPSLGGARGGRRRPRRASASVSASDVGLAARPGRRVGRDRPGRHRVLGVVLRRASSTIRAWRRASWRSPTSHATRRTASRSRRPTSAAASRSAWSRCAPATWSTSTPRTCSAGRSRRCRSSRTAAAWRRPSRSRARRHRGRTVPHRGRADVVPHGRLDRARPQPRGLGPQPLRHLRAGHRLVPHRPRLRRARRLQGARPRPPPPRRPRRPRRRAERGARSRPRSPRRSGNVVVFAVDRSSTGTGSVVAACPVRPHRPSTATFPLVPNRSGITTRLVLANPGATSVNASVRIDWSPGCASHCAAPIGVSVAPGATTSLLVAPSSRAPIGVVAAGGAHRDGPRARRRPERAHRVVARPVRRARRPLRARGGRSSSWSTRPDRASSASRSPTAAGRASR